MSYVAESIHNMTKADQRAWALMQTGPGFMVDRIAEAEELLNWLLSAPVPSEVSQSSEGLMSALPFQDVSSQEQIGLGAAFQAPSDSSSPKDGESVGEVTTPSRTETVSSDTQPVMQPCTHTRTDGEGV